MFVDHPGYGIFVVIRTSLLCTGATRPRAWYVGVTAVYRSAVAASVSTAPVSAVSAADSSRHRCQ